MIRHGYTMVQSVLHYVLRSSTSCPRAAHMVPRDTPGMCVVVAFIGGPNTEVVHTVAHNHYNVPSVNKRVNLCVNASHTTKPDPSHNSHVPHTQPHEHGKCTRGTHTCSQSWLQHLHSQASSCFRLSLHSFA